MPGALYVVATPIGNLDDITRRAIQTLTEVDLVACEDTRRTEKLLRHLGIRKPVVRYDDHTHLSSARKLLEHLTQGRSIALVTDAGTPGISDPGGRLVQEAVKSGVKIIPIPGPSSVTAAVSASGFSVGGHVFLGFLPRRPGRARRVLRESIGLGRTVIVFESPFRVKRTLSLIQELSPESDVVVARELTKLHEEFIRGKAATVNDEMSKRPAKGECVIMIGPALNAEENADS